MTPELWDRLKPLFEAAVEKAPADREAFLATIDAEEEVRLELQELVKAFEASESTGESLAEQFQRLVPAVTSALLPGDVLAGRFRIVRWLGRGGMGDVYEAEDLQLSETVALKTIHASIAGRPEVLARFKKEVHLARRLTGPNLCRIHELFVPLPDEPLGCGPFLTMELLEGVTLSEEIARNGPLTWVRAREIALELCGALELMHSAGMIHRDVKTRNVMLAKRHGITQVVLMDFGLAREVEPRSEGTTALTMAGELLGTPETMAPEQFAGGALSPATDIYAIGVVLYEMLTGREPFAASDAVQAAILRGSPAAPPSTLRPGLPRHLDRVIARCLEFNPQRRYQSTAELKRDLCHESFLRRRTARIGTIPVPPAAGTRDRKKAFRRLAIGFASFVILALAVIPLVRLLHPRRATLLTGKDTIVVGELTNNTGDPVFDGTLRQALTIELEQSPYLNVLPDRRMLAILNQMSRPANTRFTEEVTREICLRTNSTAYLTFSIAKLGDHYLLGLRALQCETDQTLASSNAEARSRNEVVKAIGDLGNEIRKKLGESLTSVAKFNKPLAEATTSSLEALQAFTMVRNVQHEKGDAASIPYAKRALQLDPDFAQGYATLALIYRNLGERALAAENLQQAYARRDRATQRERFFIEASYYSFVIGDLEQANATYTEWTQTYPRDASPHVNLTVNYVRLGDYANALEQMQEAHALASDNANVYADLMECYLGLNRIDEAKAAFDEARSRKVDSQDLRANRYIVAFLQNDASGMKEQFDAAMGKPGFEDKLLQAQSDTEAYYGRFGSAREFSDRAVDSAAHANALERAAEYKANEGLHEAEAGNASRARKMAMDALAMNSVQDVESIAALALARAGDVSGAARLADKLTRSSPHNTYLQRYVLPTIQAAIALDGKQYDKAVQILTITTPYERSGFSFSSLYPAYVRGLAYLEAKQAAAASAEFRKVLEQRGVVQNSILGALAHLRLARAEMAGGDEAGARREYEDFLALWKTADPDVPILRQAKLEYTRLH